MSFKTAKPSRSKNSRTFSIYMYTTISVVFLSHHYLKRTKAGKNKGIIRQTIKDEERWSRKQNRRQGKQKTVWTNTRIEIFSKFFELKFKSQTFLSQEQIFFGLFLRPTYLPQQLLWLVEFFPHDREQPIGNVEPYPRWM